MSPARARLSRTVFVVLAAVGAPITAALPTAGSVPGRAPEQAAPTGSKVVRFDKPGGYRYRVPAGVTRLTFTVNGAQGGRSGGNVGPEGGRGGSTIVTLDVTPGDAFFIAVGGKGGDGNGTTPRLPSLNGGSNGGGEGPGSDYHILRGAGGGGGASDVRRGGEAIANRIIVAGGGGGSGGYHTLGNPGNDVTGGGAGNGGNGKNLGRFQGNEITGGKGGSATAGGGGGRTVFLGQPGGEGASGQVANGGRGGWLQSPLETGGSGGGGGGGMYGGGGGGGAYFYGRQVYPGGGGGGGGGFAAPGLAANFVQGVQSGNGLVTITENPGTPPTLTCPTPPLATVGQDSFRLPCEKTGLPIPHDIKVIGDAPPPKPTIDSSDFAVDLDWNEDDGNQLNKAGTYTFTLSAGNGVLPDGLAPVSITVNPRQTETTIKSSAPTSEFGDVVTFTASVPAPTGVAVTGAVEFFDGTTALGTAAVGADHKASLDVANLPGGSHEIRAEYRGDANNLPSMSEPITQQVDPVASETSVTSSHNPAVSGQPITFRARVDITGRDRLSADGQVRFVVDGEPSGAPVALEHGEAVSAPITDLSVGTHKVEARYLGSPNFDPSQGTLDPDQRVNKAQTTVQLESTPNPSYESQPIEFRVTVLPKAPGGGTPGGQVELREGDTRIGQPATLDGGRATIRVASLKDGLHRIVAVYDGSDRFLGDTSPVVEQRVRDLRAVSVTPVQATVRRGETLQLVATGRFADGSTQDLTTVVNWSSSNRKAATVSDRGAVTVPANAPEGSVTIVAKLFGRDGHTSIVVRRGAAGGTTPTTKPAPAPTAGTTPTTPPPTKPPGTDTPATDTD